MAIPMPKQQDIRRLDRQGVSRSEIARRLNVDRATVAKYADMDDMTPKPPTDRRRGSKIDPYAALVDGWLEADRMLPRKQRHTAKRVHDRLRAETERRRVHDDAGVRETLARGEPERFRRIRRARLGTRRRADRFRRGEGPHRRRARGRPLPGRHVPPFEYAIRDEPARGERGMPVPRAGRGVRAHRRSPASDRHGQRHRRGTQEREGRGDAHRGVRRVPRAPPHRREVLQPLFRLGERRGGERGRVPAPQPHGPAAGGRDPHAARTDHARQMRRAGRLVEALPQGQRHRGGLATVCWTGS